MDAASKGDRTGVWLIGATGSLATTVVAGAQALAQGLVGPTGLLTATEPLSGLDWVSFEDLVFGGHEVRDRTLTASADELAGRPGFLDKDAVKTLASGFAAADAEIRPGTLLGTAPPLRNLASNDWVPGDATGQAAVGRLAADLDAFVQRHGLSRLIVVNVASTEPLSVEWPETPADVDTALMAPDGGGLLPSTFYALAAARAGAAYVNFTPSSGASAPGIQAIFEAAGLPHAGVDGKTGETLVKSALAPLFRLRNLMVLSWTGQNLLGNADGAVLTDPESRASKVRSKSALLQQILGYEPEHTVGIDFVKSLGDWKVAWDFIHFEGFLGTKMRMQFIWEGCDSALAAPVVLDLVRLVDRALTRGESGVLGALALFFKLPLGSDVHALSDQSRLLFEYLEL